MDSSAVFVVVLLVVLGVGIPLFRWYRRYKYVQDLRAYGWEYHPKPELNITHGLMVPPFGYGFERKVRDLIDGKTQAGVRFRVFGYKHEEGRSRVATARLRTSLPECVITTGGPRPGVVARVLGSYGPWVVACDNPEFADAAMRVLAESLTDFSQVAIVDLTVDGDQVVALGAPQKPTELAAFMDAFSKVVQALNLPMLQHFKVDPNPQCLTFYREPLWSFCPRDDSWLTRVEVTREGRNHRIENVITGAFGTASNFVAFTHHWETTSMRISGSGVRQQTEYHKENVFRVMLPFSAPMLRVDQDSRLGRMFSSEESVDFESSDFNRRYDVFTTDRRFAYDVIHPRMIEYLMALPEVSFAMADGTIRASMPYYTPMILGYQLGVISGFISRIPPYVWQNLEIEQMQTFRMDPVEAERRAANG